MQKTRIHATFWQRLLAHNIDIIVLVGLFYLYSLLPSLGYDSISFLLIYVFYHTIFELSPWKATPGKKWLKMSVENDARRFEDFFSVLVRNTCKIFSLLIFFGGFAMINFHKRRQSLHDILAGTIVLIEEELA